MRTFPTSSSLSKPGGTKEKLLKLIRGHPACVLALRLDVTMRISDEDIMEALAKSADNLDIDFRERFVPEEMIQEILELRLEARKEAALMSEIRRHNVWIVLIRLPLCAGVILIFISFVLFLTTFEYIRAVCALHGFANATCSQANTCLFRVAVQLPGEQFSIFHPAWKLPAEEAYGTAVFAENGPFKCCNTPSVYTQQRRQSDPNAIGAGTPCCDFVDDNRSLFCDNFGEAARMPAPVSGCPASPWACGVKTEMVDGETTVKELQVWAEVPSLQLFLAALACFGAAALVRIFPLAVAFLGRHCERFNSRFQVVAKRAKKRLSRSLKNRRSGRSSQMSTSSEPEPSERMVRKVKSKVSKVKVPVEPVASTESKVPNQDSLEVTSLDGSEPEVTRPPVLVQLRPSQQARSSTVPEVGGAAEPSPSPRVARVAAPVAPVTVTVKPARVQPKEVTKVEPVRLEEILRPIITPAAKLRRDTSRDCDLQAPAAHARAKVRAKAPRGHRTVAVAPQATVSPAKVMQMSQTQEQWMATSAQLRQLSQAQDAPPDQGAPVPRGRHGHGGTAAVAVRTGRPRIQS